MLKQKIITIALLVAMALGALYVNSPVVIAEKCGNVETSIIPCPEPGGGNVEDSGIWGVLLLVINILTAGIGVAAVGGIAYASVRYTTSGGSPDKVKEAKTIITNVVIGLVAYALLWSFLNYITPGGLFN